MPARRDPYHRIAFARGPGHILVDRRCPQDGCGRLGRVSARTLVVAALPAPGVAVFDIRCRVHGRFQPWARVVEGQEAEGG